MCRHDRRTIGVSSSDRVDEQLDEAIQCVWVLVSQLAGPPSSLHIPVFESLLSSGRLLNFIVVFSGGRIVREWERADMLKQALGSVFSVESMAPNTTSFCKELLVRQSSF
jgi:hypothetical protein